MTLDPVVDIFKGFGLRTLDPQTPALIKPFLRVRGHFGTQKGVILEHSRESFRNTRKGHFGTQRAENRSAPTKKCTRAITAEGSANEVTNAQNTL